MQHDALKKLLEDVAAGRVSAESGLASLKHLPFEDLGFAHLDHNRAMRRGFPEVIFGVGKSTDQIVGLARAVVKAGNTLFVTRTTSEAADAVRRSLPEIPIEYNEVARCIHYEPNARKIRGRGEIAVVSAGTSDIPVAEEAALTAELMGNEVTRVFDVGVSGIHRLFAHRETLVNAEVLIVVAGMEGALPSVVGGLVPRPVVAVPTSIGYGANLGGITALLAMLNSCAAGVTVVNIDNGFGAGYAASLMNRLRDPE